MSRNKKITITLSLSEALKLQKHLHSHIAKGSISTTPAWARKIIGKILRSIQQHYIDQAKEEAYVQGFKGEEIL